MYRRAISTTLEARLKEPRHFMQVVLGPRQTGKTTAARQALQSCAIPAVVHDAGAPSAFPLQQISVAWQQARHLAIQEGAAALFIDEVQKIDGWADAVKALWDEDSWNETPLHVVLSGSSSILLRHGMSDSLKGRFEVLRCVQWSLPEMSEAFGFSFEDYLVHGGYPGAAVLANQHERWLQYMSDSIVEATISQDILQLEAIKKPALLKRLFQMGAYYSGQEFSYRKILGQLDDKGNTDTLAHYLDLLAGAGMLAGLQKHYGKEYQARRSSPRFMVYDTALMSTVWGDQSKQLAIDADLRGRLVESAVGACLLNRSATQGFTVRWWRDGDYEVDFVVQKGSEVVGIEVKSGRVKGLDGLAAFASRFPQARLLVLGEGANSVEGFLRGEVPLFG